jgi:hypothetical protein
MSFAGLKRRNADFDKLANQFNTTKKDSSDDRFYYPERDDQGNGYAIIRFLPTGDDSPPFVKYYSHRFQGMGGWFWNNCRTTIEEECPVCELNRELIKPHGNWDSCPEDVKTLVRKRKRQLRYVSNIYVVKDPANPENEGKVFLFQYGYKIMEKIKQAIKPEFEDETPFDPYNPWSGANFTLKIRKVKNQTNYDSSEFKAVGPMLDSDEAIEALESSLYDLGEFNAEDFFRSYDDQKNRLVRVLGLADREAATPTSEPAAPAPAAAPEVSAETPATSNLADQDELNDLFEEDDDVPF